MNEFVNYKKRNVNLPWGCKDLLDVLQSQQLKAGVSGLTTVHEKSFAAARSEIGKYVEMMLKSRAILFMLEMDAPDNGLKLGLSRMEGGIMFASVEFREGSGQEATIRSFLAREGLKVPCDAGMPAHFLPDSPVWLSHRISPLPTDGRGLADLLTRLFRDVCGLKEEDGLRFHCFEFSSD
jgi:hypothetical protein